MPKFYLNIREDDNISPDVEGSELPNLDAAITLANDRARKMLTDALRANREVAGKVIEVADEDGSVVATVALRDLLRH